MLTESLELGSLVRKISFVGLEVRVLLLKDADLAAEAADKLLELCVVLMIFGQDLFFVLFHLQDHVLVHVIDRLRQEMVVARAGTLEHH